jgi:hypothetical protein
MGEKLDLSISLTGKTLIVFQNRMLSKMFGPKSEEEMTQQIA